MNPDQMAAFESLEEEARRLQMMVERVVLASGNLPPEGDILRELALTLTATANIIRTTVRAAKMRAVLCEPLCPFNGDNPDNPAGIA